ncbi:NAD(P)-dependent oxidoreductase [Cohnella zeiphila]|uniref:NAD(P)-dependent oxidoreductase n=1 Tax=Cohnella zeiphila TaxID=2761120 RepID=A0A7X0VWM2_9BACL|nr:NAD(P)-dependent oxidoreductase [Cohnella zeiphila]MBB6733116.1 NAD(P)-dependent oxidoreductase [Cohnella zeiphila]
MKIAVIAAGGKAGSNIAKEAASRDHEVTAIVRNAAKAPAEAAHVVVKDMFELTSADLTSYDVVVNAAGFFEKPELNVDAGRRLIEALKGSDTRLIVVGGAGSLFADPGKTVRLFDTPEFPDAFRPLAKSQGQNLEDLQAAADLKWTFVSPSAQIAPGRRTGSYLKGKDHLLVNSQGESYVSYEDYAVAVVDEIERAAHVKERITVASEK